MKRMRASAWFPALALGGAMLTGCWDRKEMDELAFVMASGLDLTEDGKIESSLQIALPTDFPSAVQAGGGKGEKAYTVISAAGKDGMESLGKLQQQLSRRINLGHRRVIIIDEKLARSGINVVLDTLMRAPESRYNSYIATSFGTSAKAIISTPYSLEKLPGIGINNIMEGEYSVAVKVDEFLDLIADYGKNPVTPAIQITKTDTGTPTIVIDKLAVYRDNKLMGFLSGEAKSAYRLLQGNSAGIPWSIAFNPPTNEYKGTVNMQFLKASQKISTKQTPSGLNLSIALKAAGRIISNDTDLDISNPKVIAELEQRFSEDIKQALSKVVNQSQKEFKSDIFGFGQRFHIQHPHEWKRIRQQWGSMYPEASVTIDTKIRIERVGRTQAPGYTKRRYD